MKLIILLSAFLSVKAMAVDSRQAVRAILGESVGEGPEGMLAVAGAIRNRGTLRGVYGVRNPVVGSASDRLRAMARLAWAMSATNDITRGATHWENVGAFGVPGWAGGMTVTTNVGQHTFYRRKR